MGASSFLRPLTALAVCGTLALVAGCSGAAPVDLLETPPERSDSAATIPAKPSGGTQSGATKGTTTPERPGDPDRPAKTGANDPEKLDGQDRVEPGCATEIEENDSVAEATSFTSCIGGVISRGDDADFIHMEVYKDNTVDKGFRPQLLAWGLRSEPWLFTVGTDGKVAARLEGAFSVKELNEAVDAAAKK